MPTVQVLLETTTDVMVDISADYKMFTTTRGRNRELDRFQAGTAQVTLLDTSRKYDPSNAAGPYYPNLKPMRSLQLTGTWLGTTYPVFTGFVDSFESEYDGPPSGYAQTTIYATDGFKVLEAADLASSAYAQEVIADSPSHWWRLGDTAAPYLDSVGITHLDVGVGKNAPTPGADGLVSRDTDEALTFLELNTVQLVAPTGSAPTGTVYTVELLIKTPLPPSTTRNIAYWEDAAFNNSQISISGAADAGSLLWEGMSTSPLHPADDSPHHVAVVQTASERLIYVDGTLIISTAGAGSFTGGGKMYLGTSSTNNFGGVVDEVAVYNTALSAARIAAHAAARTTPWNGDLPGARIGRVLDAVAWPGALRQLDTGTSTLQSADLDMPALEHAQKAAESDFGVLFITAEGKVRFIGRAGLFNLAELATFGDGGGAELGYVSLRPELTDQLIRNDVTVSRLEGVAQNVKDTTSIATYLRHSYVTDGLYHNSDTVSRAAADFLISEFKDPQRRISNMVVAPRGDPSNLFPKILGLELENQITVKDRPPGGGAVNTQDTSIEGIGHTVTPMWWETTWNLAPSFGSQGTPAAVGQWDITLWDQSRWGF
jgi:hypothetical protein